MDGLGRMELHRAASCALAGVLSSSPLLETIMPPFSPMISHRGHILDVSSAMVQYVDGDAEPGQHPHLQSLPLQADQSWVCFCHGTPVALLLCS